MPLSPPPFWIKQDQEDTSTMDSSSYEDCLHLDTSTMDPSSYEDCLHLGIAFFKQQMSLLLFVSGRFLDEHALEWHGKTYMWWKGWG